MRPCTKEYSIYKLDQEQANKKRDQDLFTFCTTEVRQLNRSKSNKFFGTNFMDRRQKFGLFL